MKELIRKLSAPLAFEDEEKTRVANVLHLILWGIVLVSLSFFAAMSLFNPRFDTLLAVIAPAIGLVSLVLLIVLRRGFVRLASLLLAFVLWCAFSLIVVSYDGIRDSGMAGYFFVIVLVSLLCRWQAVSIFSLMTILMAAGLYFAEMNGLLVVTMDPLPSQADLAIVMMTVLLIALLLRISLQQIARGFARARHNEQVALEANQTLQAEIAERRRVEKGLQWRAETLAALHETALDLASQRHLPDLLWAVVKRAVDLLQVRGGGIFLYRPPTDDLELAVTLDPKSDYLGDVLKRGQGLCGKVLETGRTLVVDDYSQWIGRADQHEPDAFTACAGIPILWGDRLLGVLSMVADLPQTFAPEDVALLEQFTPLAAAALEQNRLLDEARTRWQEAETLREAGAAVTASLSLDETLIRILEQLERVVPYDSASVLLLGEGYVELVSGRGFPESAGSLVGRRFPIPGDNPSTVVVETREPLVLPDVQSRYPEFRQAPFDHICSWLGVPLVSRGRVIGTLSLDSRTLDHFDQEHVRLIIPFANQAAAAIENARLFEETRRWLEQLGALHRASLALSQEQREVAAVLDSVSGRAMDLLEADGCGVWLWHEREGELELVVTYQPAASPLVGHRFKPGEGLAGRALVEQQTQVVENYAAWPGRSAAFEGLPIAAGLAAPMIWQRQVIGVLVISRNRPGQAFSRAERELAELLASQAAAFVQNAQLVEGLEEEVLARTADIRAEQEKSETILRSVGDALATTDLALRVTYVNSAFSALTGYAAEEIVGRSLRPLILDRLPPQDQQVLTGNLERGMGWHGEISVCRQDGRGYDAFMTIAPVRNARGELVGFIFSHHDISQIKELERARSRFITNVSHQLRTPVTSMKLYSQMLRQGVAPDKTVTYLESLEKESDRLAHLVQDILEITELDGGAASQGWETISLASVARDVATRLRQQAETAGLNLEIDLLPDKALLVNGNPVLLSRALAEVVENALQFTPAGGHVTVTVRPVPARRQEWVAVTVSDTGPGIPADEQVRVFERFFRGQIVDAGHVAGTGLGLSMTQQILEAHGGRVTVDSSVGQGSTFTLWLRRALPAE